MKVLFDSESDILNIILRDEKISESDEIKEGVIVDYSKKGEIISIEILDASEHVLTPQSMSFETLIPSFVSKRPKRTIVSRSKKKTRHQVVGA